MTITHQTTFAQFELEVGKLGIDEITWIVSRGRHVVSLSGPGFRRMSIHGFGQDMIHAMDDAFTSLVQHIGSELIKAD